MSKEIMTEEAFYELIENLEVVDKLTIYGKNAIKYWVLKLQKENKLAKEQLKKQCEIADERNDLLVKVQKLQKENEKKDIELKELQLRKDNQEKRFRQYKEDMNKKHEEIYEDLVSEKEEKDKQIELMAEYIYNTQIECNVYYKDKKEVKQYFENKAKEDNING